MLRFLRSNYGYLIWFVFYFSLSWLLFVAMLGNGWEALGWSALIYGVSLTMALSPIGEKFLRWYKNMHPVQTREDREYLLPIYEEVYQKAKEAFPRLSDKVKLYIDDDLSINACAIGRKTVAVTRGAMSTLSEDELKGVLAHEFGHLKNGDTKARLLNLIGNGFFTLTVFCAKAVIEIVRAIIRLFKIFGGREESKRRGRSIAILIFNVIVVLFNIYIFTITVIGQLILSATSRQAEYYADRVSHEIGLSDELIQALYILQKTSIPAKTPILVRLKASHPNLAGRIARLEGLTEE